MVLGIIVSIIKVYLITTIVIMTLYAIRHAIFSFNRMYSKQRIYYSDLYDSELPFITVLMPMHNEEKVLENSIRSLMDSDYDKDKFEIIAINDNSTDSTGELLDKLAMEYPQLKPFHRKSELRGKPAALNDAMELAKGEFLIVFDADYLPSTKMLKELSRAMSNPEIGAVMGRVIPHNHAKNLLTRLLYIERVAGYQVDQQARYNMRLIPQYGGTVGGYRKSLIKETGGFNIRALAEDTELTFRLYTMGYKVMYANDAECYEESPETWLVRGKQVRRWSRGHNYVMFRYLFKLLGSKFLSFKEKVDGVFLLFIYLIPTILFFALAGSLTLFFLGEMNILSGWWVILFLTAYNSYGNFAPFYEIGTGLMIDGLDRDQLKIPLMMFSFFVYLIYLTLGFFDSIGDSIFVRDVTWDKTKRFKEEVEESDEEVSEA